MLQKSMVAAAWACLAFIAYATLSPLHARPVIAGGYFTVVERFGAYALLGLLFYAAYSRRLKFVWIVVLGSAVVLEFLQALVPDRDPRILDAIEKLLGGAAGIASAWIVQSSVWKRRSAVQRPTLPPR
jgi:VanZ family protein